MMSTEKDSSPDVEELLAMLDDPDIGEATKETIRQGLRSLATGGFKEAYRTNLGYLSRSDLNSFSEYVFGWTPYDHHKEITKVLMDDSRKRELIVIPPGHGKCQSKHTVLQKASGQLTTIENIEAGDRILSVNPKTLKIEPKKVLWKEETGEKECFRIRTKSGYYVDVTADHRMYTFKGWKECRDIKAGDFMAAPYELPEVENPIHMNENEIKFLSYWIAEGCRAATVLFSNTDLPIIREWESIAESFGFKHRRIFRNGKAIGARMSGRVSGVLPKHILINHGLDPSTCGAHDKFVPDAIFCAPNEQVALFLNRLFACDGTLSSNGKKRDGTKTATISYTSVSRRLVDDIRTLLLRFGIRSSISSKMGRYRGSDGEVVKTSEVYTLSIQEGRLVHKFMDEIGMFTKDERFTGLLKDSTRSIALNSVSDRIPAGWREDLRKSTSYYRFSHNIRIDKPGGTSRSKIALCAEIEDNDDLLKLAASDIRWDEVVSIESIGTQETFDIEVEDNHNFFANGLLSHNSSYVSVQFPAWFMGKNPEKSIILVSNTATQAEKFGAAVRDIIDGSREYKSVFPEAKKDESRGWTKAELFLANRKNKAQPDPNLFSTGTGGPVLGRRADLIITDDMTSQDDASSQKIMEDQKLWFKETLMSRMTPGGKARIISILTRWSDKDLASMMMNDLGFRLTHMPALGDPERGSYVDYVLPGAHYSQKKDEKLEELLEETLKEGKPAEITYSDAVHRWCVRKWMHEQPALWPTEFSYDTVAQIKKEYGSVRFNLVYQGNPTGLKGDVFKRDWFKYYGPGEEFESIPPEANFYQSVDVAVSKKESADYFVVLTAAVDNFGNIFIVDVYRSRIEAPEQAKLVAYKYREYPKTLWTLIESVAYQQALFQAVSNEGIPCRPYRPAKDKEARARSASARFEAGKVYINKLASWRQTYEDELTSFPRAEHDDQVDATSSLLEEIALRAAAPIVLEVGFE